MPYGLPRKIRIAFTLQALMVSLTLLLGGYLAVLVVKHTFVVSILQEEAAYYWAHADGAPPNTKHIRGYVQRQGESDTVLPNELRVLRPGFHEVEGTGELVWVETSGTTRLYLVFKRSDAWRMAFWFGVIPVILVLLAIYAVSWLTYRASRRLVSPISWLARRIASWDPRHPDAAGLAPEQLPLDVQGEARQLAIALHTMANRVGEHIAREQAFTRDASHALRTPLTVVRVASDMALAEQGMSARVQRSVLRIQRAARDMEAVIESMLILARESEVDPLAERVEVGQIARAEAEQLRGSLAGKPVELYVHVSDPCEIWAPARVVQLIVGNLLRNAQAATEAGRIDVEVTAQRLVVRDTGVGMSAESARLAFEPFYRGGTETHMAKGAGLGLSVVKRLCERFDWRIQLESELGQGTAVAVLFSPDDT